MQVNHHKLLIKQRVVAVWVIAAAGIIEKEAGAEMLLVLADQKKLWIKCLHHEFVGKEGATCNYSI